MGPCVSTNTKKSLSKQNKFTRYTSYELQLLQMMFQDIASRGSKPGMIRQHFDSFFHLNGLWGDQMFRTFDKNQRGYITFQEFLTSIDIMVKGTFEQKSHILFNFYDSDKSGGISYNQLVKMLFSYPKSQLNRMVTEENFLNSIDNYQKNFYFYPEKMTFREMNVVDQDSQSDDDKNDMMMRINSVQGATIRTSLNQDSQAVDKQGRKNQLLMLKKGQRIDDNNSKQKKIGSRQQQPFQSILTQTKLQRQRKKYVVRSNIASLVRKYASFLFKQFRLDIRKQQMGFDNFQQLIKNHQSIFNSYFQGFHSYVWQFDQNSQTPEFRRNSPWIQSPCQFYEVGQQRERYLYFVKTTIFVLGSAKAIRPIQIINMQGLTIEQLKQCQGNEIIIKHRDGIYPQKKCIFFNKQLKDEWMTHLQQYKSTSIYDCYTFIDKVGEGNFSSVYKGVSKDKNQQVAIKVIKKFQLSLNEKNVLKSECNILQLCHHPNILKFFGIFNTRSHLYIVTEYLSQGDLFQYVKTNTFLEQYESAFMMKQLVQVIKYFGQIDLIHRDLKPQNVMMVMNKEKNMVQKVKIIDFGFAVYKSNLKGMDPKEKFAGTPGFIAPEIVNCQDFDENVDIFSLGVILYFMLCGSLPFFSSFLEQIIEQTKQCNITLKNVHWNNISQEAKDLVYRMITFKHQRISLKQLIEHPWLQNIQQLKKYNKANKKNRYI